MKYKIFAVLLCIASLFLTSCGALAQVSIDTQLGTITTYYDVYNTYPVIYHQGTPYYRYYLNNMWRYRIIPLEHRHLIIHLDKPRDFRHMPPLHYRRNLSYRPSSTRYNHRILPPHRTYSHPHRGRNFHRR